MSRGKNGKTRIEYDDHEAHVTVLFEQIGKHVLESRFDANGGILDQKIIQRMAFVDEVSNGFLKGIGASDIAEQEYTDVVLQKDCPKCGSSPLTRYLDTLSHPDEAPVMPLYVCSKCSSKSYHLTDTYLKNLVSTNKSLFDEKELSQLGKDERGFMGELRAYIIRIFASKRIMHIE